MDKKEYWVTNSRFKLITIIMIFMWLGVMTLLYLKADEVTNHPCNICADRHSSNIICYVSGQNLEVLTRTFTPDGDTYDGKA